MSCWLLLLLLLLLLPLLGCDWRELSRLLLLISLGMLRLTCDVRSS